MEKKTSRHNHAATFKNGNKAAEDWDYNTTKEVIESTLSWFEENPRNVYYMKHIISKYKVGNEWLKRSVKKFEGTDIPHLANLVKTTQEVRLVDGGLRGELKVPLVKMLLNASHGIVETNRNILENNAPEAIQIIVVNKE